MFQILIIAWFLDKYFETLPDASVKRTLRDNLKNEFTDFGESQTGFVEDEFGIELPDSICKDPKKVEVAVIGGGDVFVAHEDASWCGAKILFELLFVSDKIYMLIFNLDSDPNFCCSTDHEDLFVTVLTTVKPNSR